MVGQPGEQPMNPPGMGYPNNARNAPQLYFERGRGNPRNQMQPKGVGKGGRSNKEDVPAESEQLEEIRFEFAEFGDSPEEQPRTETAQPERNAQQLETNAEAAQSKPKHAPHSGPFAIEPGAAIFQRLQPTK